MLDFGVRVVLAALKSSEYSVLFCFLEVLCGTDIYFFLKSLIEFASEPQMPVVLFVGRFLYVSSISFKRTIDFRIENKSTIQIFYLS